MPYQSRYQKFCKLFSEEPDYRWKQVQQSIFDPRTRGWHQVFTVPKSMRDVCQRGVPWVSYSLVTLLESSGQDTYKALLAIDGGDRIETVLMKNVRNQWTICVSSQVGCAMACRFCATGKMGLVRNLSSDEIVDQYRFWQQFLVNHPSFPQRISNVVFMGMGEPLMNYENVKEALHTWLAYIDLGLTHITVSTVGVLSHLERILNDPAWPYVRLAISLHSANPLTRKQIVPTSHDQFLSHLKDWAKRYLKKCGNRRHYLTLEYVMLREVNDTDSHAKKLTSFVHSIGDIKVNLIPYNFTGIEFQCSPQDRIQAFMKYLKEHGVTVTIRKTMGDDIAAACGQLATHSD